MKKLKKLKQLLIIGIISSLTIEGIDSVYATPRNEPIRSEAQEELTTRFDVQTMELLKTIDSMVQSKVVKNDAQLKLLNKLKSDIDEARKQLQTPVDIVLSSEYGFKPEEREFDVYFAKPAELHQYLDDSQQNILGTQRRLRNYVQPKKIRFVVNAGIFDVDGRPLGLYIEDGNILQELNTNNPGFDSGNFYLTPNGVFAIDKSNQPYLFTTQELTHRDDKDKLLSSFRLAAQSGPMLIINGQINQNFNKVSQNVAIRLGVGIVNPKKVVFVLARNEVTFYEFASVFQRLGCKNALYLDGGPPVFMEGTDVLRFHPIQNRHEDTRVAGMFAIIGDSSDDKDVEQKQNENNQ